LHAEWCLDLVFDLTKDAAPFFFAARTAAASQVPSGAVEIETAAETVVEEPSVAIEANINPEADSRAPPGEPERSNYQDKKAATAAAAATVEAAALADFLSKITIEAAVWHEGHAGGPDTKAATTATITSTAIAAPSAAAASAAAGNAMKAAQNPTTMTTGAAPGEAGAGRAGGEQPMPGPPKPIPLSMLQPYGYAPTVTTQAHPAATTNAASKWTCLGPALKLETSKDGRPSNAPPPSVGHLTKGVRSPLVHLPLRRTSAALKSTNNDEYSSDGQINGQNGGSESDVLESLPPSVLVLGAAVFLGSESPS
jgi:hypothetical protein